MLLKSSTPTEKGSRTIIRVGREVKRDKKRKDRLCKDTEGSRMMQKLGNKQNDVRDEGDFTVTLILTFIS